MELQSHSSKQPKRISYLFAIPNYEGRRKVGKSIGSGRIEKGVDLVVGHRQKKKGLSWSINGSKALSLLKVAELSHCWTSLWFPAQSC